MLRLLYDVRNTKNIPNASESTSYFSYGPDISVGPDAEMKLPSVKANIVALVNTLFTCRLPNFALVNVSDD